jgi:DNA-binding SARP family transcriptional activator
VEQNTIAEQGQDIRDLATTLLEQGERCALAGRLQQAEAILIQVAALADAQIPDLANAAVWELAWLLVRRGAYTEAIEWFQQIMAPPMRKSLLWPAAQQALVQICRRLAERPAEGAATGIASGSQPLFWADPTAPTLPPLEVMNLGRFQIARDGVVLQPCPAHKATALLRYLLTRRHRKAPKEELMDLFWPKASPREAANSLYNAVSMLRRHLDPPTGSYLLLANGQYAINPAAPVADDCTAFQQRGDEGDRCRHAGDLRGAQQAYIHALACYQGDYYVDSRDLQWAVNMHEQLLSRYLMVLDRLGRIYMTQAHFEEAAECYQRLLARDGYREDAHAQLMRCYWQLDRRGDALRQYERCTTILANELGLEPLPEIQALYHAIARSQGNGT